ncbi:hypothetical protein S2M10_00560 [Sphingomonas sp. S2M10]|uniref:hypothetical protein n=1 Tax=Sphingomonas sp. S2M10 TaxID=2705010 RepID=UPI0014563A06|nr:hypothetical protein [Sphingomonas sp. S2M10]NLS25093.1 hypothetical protein [Sphingomonas sp. S2M10]
MITLDNFEITEMRSADDEAAFFSVMGRFFASATVRKDCGGYPLNDGAGYRWFVVRRTPSSEVLGFVGIEQQAGIFRIRYGYVCPDVRGHGLFRALRMAVLACIDDHGAESWASVPQTCVEQLAPYGFITHSTRGSWVTLRRNAHAAGRANRAAG